MGPALAADVAVIGGGSSGAALAARLVESGRQVVLIEAGPDYGPLEERRWPAEILDATMLATSHDWRYESGPLDGRSPLRFERARIIGGCSAHNGAIAAVGNAVDYDAWDLPGWRTDDLRATFAAVIDTMRVRAYRLEEAGPFHQACLDAARSAGWSIASDLCDLDANTSFGLETVNVVDGVRWNTAFAYLDPVRSHPGLSIVDRCLVDRIVVGRAGASVRAIRNGRPIEWSVGTVVLAAGAYGTPLILQRSGIGDPDRLRAVGIEPVHERAIVGTNLHDHPMVNTGRRMRPELVEQLANAAATGFLPEEQTLGKAASSLAVDAIFDLHLFPVCASTQTELTNGRALVEVACMNPLSRGWIHAAGPDPEAHPQIDHRYLSDPDDHDITVLCDGLAMAEALLSQPSLRRLLIDEPDADRSHAAVRNRVAHYYHPVGTAPMGLDPATSVCDTMGRIHGLDRVIVGDVALMPQIPRGNTNLPAIMIGERIARSIIDGGRVPSGD